MVKSGGVGFESQNILSRWILGPRRKGSFHSEHTSDSGANEIYTHEIFPSKIGPVNSDCNIDTVFNPIA